MLRLVIFGDGSRPGSPVRVGLIIGAMKSGTTSLFDILSQHPQIAPCKTKEPDFFSERGAADWEDYLGLFRGAAPGERVGLEASVSYAKWPWVDGVPERIASAVPDESSVRFIYVLRNPIERIESQVRHALFAGWGEPLDDGLPSDAIDFSRYASQIDRYLEHFSRESLLVFTLEEFSTSSDEMLVRCCEHLEIDPSFQFHGASERRNTGSYFGMSAGLRQLLVLVRAAEVARWVLPRRSRDRIRDFVGRKFGGGESEGRHYLTEAERRDVLLELGPELVRLRDRFGVDVDRYWPGLIPS